MEQVQNKIIGVRKAGVAAAAIIALSVNSDTLPLANAVIIGIVAVVAIMAHAFTGINKNVVRKTKDSETTAG